MKEHEEIANIFGDSDEDDADLGDIKDLEKINDELLPSFKKSQIPTYSQVQPRKPKRKPKEEQIDVEQQEELTPEMAKKLEVQSDINGILKRLKPQRNKGLDLQNEVEIDEIVNALLESMKEAAFTDRKFNRNQQPAIAKLKLLKNVMVHLTKPHWYGILLEANVLEYIKFWLEPLADGSLPSLDIQKSMFEVLQQYPVETSHLRQSLIGRVVMFYTKCERVLPQIKRIAETLVRKWIRPILGKSADHRHKILKESRIETKSKRRHIATPTSGRAFASVPLPIAPAFSIAPAPNISQIASSGQSQRDDRYKNIKMKMKSMGMNKK